MATRSYQLRSAPLSSGPRASRFTELTPLQQRALAVFAGTPRPYPSLRAWLAVRVALLVLPRWVVQAAWRHSARRAR